jgi:antibiotic biosynthesis monooxygenase (ABM) superfamily enzyme
VIFPVDDPDAPRGEVWRSVIAAILFEHLYGGVRRRSEAPLGTNQPVTAVASRRVKKGREQEFEEWTSGILAAANGFPGYLGSEVLKPGDGPGDDEYRIAFRFDRESNMRAWERSEERQRWLRKAEPLIHEEKVHVLTGLETWFTLPWKAG